MAIRLVVMTACLVMAVASASAQEGAEKRFAQVRNDYTAADTAAKKAEVLNSFLKEFPESRYTLGVLREGVRLLAQEAGDALGALALVTSILDKVENKDLRFDIRKIQAQVYGSLGKIAEMSALITELQKEKEFGYRDHSAVIEAAITAKQWQMALDHSAAAHALAKPEVVWAELPESSRDKETAERTAKSRKGEALASKGWALANLGRTDEGLAVFTDAEATTDFFYLGFPETSLYYYWGHTLSKHGEYDEAIEKLAPGAVLGGRTDELEALKGAYSAKNGSAAGFDKFVWEKRMELAKPVADFTLPDYEGDEHSFESLKGKVTLLNFWFPT